MPIPLRTDFDALQVQAAAKAAKDGPQVRRLLALVAIYDGGTRNEAARMGGVTLQIARAKGIDLGRTPWFDPADLEVWFGDEARIGQKNKLTRRWVRRGTQPSAPLDQRTASTYIFGAICPKDGKGAGLVLPWCNIEAMALHLAAISHKVAPGRHAALLLEQTGWHVSAKLLVLENITIVPLRAKCPELNPQENVWQFMRDNWLSNRVFTSYDNLLDHCCAAWNKLVDAPWTIMSLGLRDWAHEF